MQAFRTGGTWNNTSVVIMLFCKLNWGRRNLNDDLESKLYIKISKNITHILCFKSSWSFL